MKTIHIKDEAGVFAENKDIASDLRSTVILPALRQNEEVTLDFEGVDGATQSFIHALISQAIREIGPNVIDHIIFIHCNASVRGIVEIVIAYMQESLQE